MITKDISEQTDIKAITSKENLLYLKISCTVEFSFSILKEIEKKGIDLFYKALEQDNLTLVFSQPEENEINLLLMDIEFEELCREKINAFSIVGVKVNQNFEFSSRLTDFLLEKKIDIFGCVFEDLKLTFYSKNTIVDIKKRIEEIHNMFIV